ncbi:Glycosyltransferase involved in cell wall bisynthesis [Granulicatella balaenopterae]|uniref:Glycosyltransferase involved in cell wall bisynthesis n=1 Tax=Granulicatella balaenopterae TaxID=137733 RepID=A0A1H9K9J4_9LACT|nr:glycosyltransferase [Granulicatella balaenopterae]SEQ95583.1 Glycosyltransferase involved in cell wall bisynthesis [Granulicatella balaenopterae]
MNKIRVMFVTGSLTNGGAERVISILSNGCAKLGVSVVLVILRERKETYRISDQVICYRIKSEDSKFKLFTRIRELRKIIKKEKIDILVPFLPIVTIYTVLANIGINNKIIMVERADPYFTNTKNIKDVIGNIIFRKMGLYSLADAMVFQTEDAANYYKKFKKIKTVIVNPLDVSDLPTPYKGKRKKEIVAIGRLSSDKNFQLLIEGFAEFSKIYDDYKLIIYGEGEERKNLEKKIIDDNLSGKVELPGFQNNVLESIRNASIYVSTSNHEGISNSMLEALSIGVPTIVTDCPIGGARMFVKSNYNGILIPVNNKEKLVEAMLKIVGNQDFSKKISLNAIKIKNELGDNIFKKWITVFEYLKEGDKG